MTAFEFRTRTLRSHPRRRSARTCFLCQLFLRRRSLAHDGGAVSTSARDIASIPRRPCRNSNTDRRDRVHFVLLAYELMIFHRGHEHNVPFEIIHTKWCVERNKIALRSVSCLCATDGRRLLHPPSADGNECHELVAIATR